MAEPEVDDRLLTAANTVISAVAESLGDLGIAFILTDSRACVMRRWTAGTGLVNRLDTVNAHPGHLYAEEAIGTNAVGTAIETGMLARVDGSEHYSSAFLTFTCVGVPIRDPISRRLRGILDVTAAADHNNRLITVVAQQAASAIEQVMAESGSVVERALLAEFMRARRRTAGVAVVSDRILISDPHAARILEGTNQPQLWEYAAGILQSEDGTREVTGWGNGPISVTAAPVRLGSDAIGAVLQVRDKPVQSSAAANGASQPRAAKLPPELIGTNAAFAESCHLARREFGRSVLVIAGETGTGKSWLAQVLHNDRQSEALHIHDALSAVADGYPAWLEELRGVAADGQDATIVVENIDLLPGAVGRAAAGILLDAQHRGMACLATKDVLGTTAQTFFAGNEVSEIRLPALRDRTDDIPKLAASFATPRKLSSTVIQILLRLPWEGNIRQLQEVVKGMVSSGLGPSIEVSDLPPELSRTALRRNLSRFQRGETYIILDALRETGGSKQEAAALLGISRSTLYRKLQAAGLELDKTAY
ncbi:sigma-54-dependent Fis family transcriptional regulator [Arthrobacter sp. TS-15]|uniref:sigma-54-dependent Fis family transcriptional regulator n=1 Tax=Arthrobacter sp. TS-15 TaxID=2510797 RepID=UPI001357755D|nr:helix-turn-helix domain-containing protein [Arthrobacter sp. TS-15]